MKYAVKILADSMSPMGHRLTSFEVTLPRIVLAEFNTHRTLSRNSASSRAIPAEKMMKKVKEDPFIPVHWGKNQKGMQAEEELSPELQKMAEEVWRGGMRDAVKSADALLELGVHKQITNRLLETWLPHTIVTTGTEWENFFNLRRDKAAQPEIRKAAEMMFEQYNDSQPVDVDFAQWHLPLVRGNDHGQLLEEQYTAKDIAKISCGRCGRVSYLTHDGIRDPKADVAIVDEKFAKNGHMSPLEHAARPMFPEEYELFAQLAYKVVNIDGEDRLVHDKTGTPRHFCGNVEGWIQYRKLMTGEDVFRLTQL